jgi:acetate---CoA ligase (ADP-forming)
VVGGGRPDPVALLAPRSVAVVGANDRPGSYADHVLRNLAAAGFEGPVWGVNPKRETVHGHPCVPALADLPEAVDAVVVAIPAAGVSAAVGEAAARDCGGAIVISAGFGETACGVGLERELAQTARASGIAVCGPNCNGVVSVAARAPLWGDSVERLAEGPVALITQSGNVGVNALGSRRGLGFHTVVSTGNQAVLDASDWIEAVAALDGVGSIALFLEADGDGERLARALASCAERGIGVAVLKVGSSAAGARAAGAHTGALAGDQRVFAALLEEAGAAVASDPGELLELARCLARPRSRPSGDGGLAVLTCSGGDSGIAADLADRLGLELPELAPATRERLAELLPGAATIANPLDYTALLWDQPEVLEKVAAAVGSDPGIDQLLLLFDQPDGLAPDVGAEWEAVRSALVAGAERSGAAVMLGSTLPELLEHRSAHELARRGIATAAGLGEAMVCARALRAVRPDPERLREIATAAGPPGTGGEAPLGTRSFRDGGQDRVRSGEGGWRGEVETKRLLRDAGIAVPAGVAATSAEEAAAAARELGGPVALKLSSPLLQHKSEVGALVLGLRGKEEVREEAERLLSLPAAVGATLLVEEMRDDGVELLFAAHRDGVVPVLVVGLGGIWAEAMDDVALVPLPASPAAVERALRGLRGAALFDGSRGRPTADLSPAAEFGSRLGDLLLQKNLDLIEVNPALLTKNACIALDALARHPT